MEVKKFIYGICFLAVIYFISRVRNLMKSEAKVIDEDKNIIEYLDDGIVSRAKIKGNLHGLSTIRLWDYKVSFMAWWLGCGILKYASISAVMYFSFLVLRSALRG